MAVKRLKSVASAQKTDALLFARFFDGGRLRRQLQHGRFLTFAQQRQQHDTPIGKFKRVVMGGQLILVDLTEDRGLVVDRLGLPPQKTGRQAGNFAGEGQLGSGPDANGQTGIVGGGEPARSRPEVARDELVADLRRPRSHALKAKVAHGRLLSSRVEARGFRYSSPTNPTRQRLRARMVPPPGQKRRCGARRAGDDCWAPRPRRGAICDRDTAFFGYFRGPSRLTGRTVRYLTVMPPTMPLQSWSAQRRSYFPGLRGVKNRSRLSPGSSVTSL